MAGFGYVCALVLAAVLVRAAAAKLARPEQTGAGFSALGLPAPRVLGRLVPVVELAVAVLLVATPAAGGIAAFALLAGFTIVLARAVGAGVETGCTCFGALSREPVSVADVLRNLLLMALAVAAWWATGPAVPSPRQLLAAALAVLAGGAALRVTRGRLSRDDR